MSENTRLGPPRWVLERCDRWGIKAAFGLATRGMEILLLFRMAVQLQANLNEADEERQMR
jgi:hypothetical protein